MLDLLIQIFIFIFATLTAFIIPGLLIVDTLKLRFDNVTKFFIATCNGILLFTLISYALTYFKLESLIFPLIVLINITYIVKIKPRFNINKKFDLVLIPLLILAVAFALSMITSGFRGDTLLARRDDYWHLSLIYELFYNFPPNFPTYSNLPLTGYHFFYNLLLASLAKTYRINIPDLYFYFYPLLNSLLWALGVYSITLLLTKNKATSVFTVFMSMFAGSLAIIYYLIGHHGLNLDDGLGMLQPILSLQNPPFSTSILFILTFLILIKKYYEKLHFNYLVPLILVLGLTPMFKVYAGIIIYAGFTLMVLYELFKRRFRIFYVIAGAFSLFATSYLIFVGNAGGLIYYPFWSPKKVFLDNLKWFNYEEKHYTYYTKNVIKGIVYLETFTTFVFIFGNISTRIIGILIFLYKFIRRPFMPSIFGIVFIAMISVSLIIPLLFIQSIQVFETTQFYWYFLFLLSIATSLGFKYLFTANINNALKIFLISLIIIATIPSAVYRFVSYPNANKEDINDAFNKSMIYLSESGTHKDVYLIIPPEYTGLKRELIMQWHSTTIPTAYYRANMQPFMAPQYIQYPTLDTRRRMDIILNVVKLNQSNKFWPEFPELEKRVQKELKKEQIKYIYSPYKLTLDDNLDNVKEVFNSEENYIYKVN